MNINKLFIRNHRMWMLIDKKQFSNYQLIPIHYPNNIKCMIKGDLVEWVSKKAQLEKDGRRHKLWMSFNETNLRYHQTYAFLCLLTKGERLCININPQNISQLAKNLDGVCFRTHGFSLKVGYNRISEVICEPRATFKCYRSTRQRTSLSLCKKTTLVLPQDDMKCL